MKPLNMLLVGCGMMGARHVRGFGELKTWAPGTMRLRAVCDMRRDAAETVADEAEELLGERPAVFEDVQAALDAGLDLEAADIVTGPRSHNALAVTLMQAGLDVICEKPLALTIERGQRMLETAEETERTLATAENNRRDPMNRLVRACINGGLIGEPNFALQLGINPAGRITATRWRHRLAMGGLILDVGLHQGYVLEQLMGPIQTVRAQTQLVQPHRSGTSWEGQDVEVDVDSEDCFSALLRFDSGAQGQWSMHFASPGETMFKRLIIGDRGTINCPSDRSGAPVSVRRGADTLSEETLLAEVPEYELNEIETRLFGERPGSYSFENPETDRKLIAAEMHDFVAAIENDRPPEADGAAGLRSVAIIYAILESALAGEEVAVDEVLAGKWRDYQDHVEGAE